MDSKEFASEKVFHRSIGFVPHSIIENRVGNESGFIFVTYFKWTFNVLYYTGFVPFRPGKFSLCNDKPLQEHFIQQILCGTIHLLSLTYWISTVASQISKPFPKDPLDIFALSINIAFLSIIFTFIATVWISKEPISIFFEGVPASNSLNLKKYISFGLMSISPVAVQIANFVAANPWLVNPSLIPNSWAFLAKQQLPRLNYPYNASHYYYYLESNNNESLESESENKMIREDDDISELRVLSGGEKTLIVCGVLMSNLSGIMKTFADLIMSLAVFSVWEVLTKRTRVMGETMALDKNIFVDLYLDTESLINKINDLFGSLTLAIYIFNVISLSATLLLVGGGSIGSVAIKVWLFISFVYPIAVISCAAVAYNKGCDFRGLLLSKTSEPEDNQEILDDASRIDLDQINVIKRRREEDLSHSFMAYLEITEGSLGVRGGDFFTYSFAFLGSTLCFSLTFLLLMIQLTPPGSSTTIA